MKLTLKNNEIINLPVRYYRYNENEETFEFSSPCVIFESDAVIY